MEIAVIVLLILILLGLVSIYQTLTTTLNNILKETEKIDCSLINGSALETILIEVRNTNKEINKIYFKACDISHELTIIETQIKHKSL
jgi:hypothetical protein